MFSSARKELSTTRGVGVPKILSLPIYIKSPSWGPGARSSCVALRSSISGTLPCGTFSVASLVTGRLFLGSGRCHWTLASWNEKLPPPAAGPLLGQRRVVEKLWREFFEDPSQWWDHRSEKDNARYPDFKHKYKQEALWLTGKLNPPWVEAELAAIALGTVHLSIFAWNKRLSRCVKAGEYEKAFELFLQMQEQGKNPDNFTFLSVLKACGSLGALEEGRYIHTQIIKSGYGSNFYVASCLVDMYIKCGSMEDARTVFDDMPRRDVVSWNAMILGYVSLRQGLEALALSGQMASEGVNPDPVTFVGLLNACADLRALEEGRQIHEEIINRGYEFDLSVGNSLVHMYVKCGSIEQAWRVFKTIPNRGVVAWNAMILGYVKCGQTETALELSRLMQQEGVDPDPVSFVEVLNACALAGALEEGRHFHEQIFRLGYESDVDVANSLLEMYVKCRSLEDAQKVFNMIPNRNVLCWNLMILGYVACGEGQKSLELYQQMDGEGVEPDPVTFVGVLNACASRMALEEGRHVHEQIIQRGYDSHVYVCSSLVNMYAKCGRIDDAWNVFKEMPSSNEVAWSAMILGCVKYGYMHRALELFQQMQQEGVEPNAVTCVGLLNACATMTALEEGRRVHEKIIQIGCESDINVGSSLIDMYAKCGCIEDACQVFNQMPRHNVVSWNAMLRGYALHGYAKDAIGHFEQMCQVGLEINEVTFVSVLSACSHAGLVAEGRHYFEMMTAIYNISPTVYHCACMVDLLGRAGHLCEAEHLIRTMSVEPDARVWNCLLEACRIHGNVEMGERVAKQVLELDPKNVAGNGL